MKDKTWTTKSLRMDDDLIERIQKLAAKENRVFTRQVAQLLEEALAHREARRVKK